LRWCIIIDATTVDIDANRALWPEAQRGKALLEGAMGLCSERFRLLPIGTVLVLLTAFALPTTAWAKTPESQVGHDSEYCEVLHRFNADKKITDAQLRARFEGEYGEAADSQRLRTWNVRTSCGEFLVAVPLWADVSPPILTPKGRNRFEDTMGGIWDFQVGENDVVSGVVRSTADGATSEMIRLGDPRRLD